MSAVRTSRRRSPSQNTSLSQEVAWRDSLQNGVEDTGQAEQNLSNVHGYLKALKVSTRQGVVATTLGEQKGCKSRARRIYERDAREMSRDLSRR